MSADHNHKACIEGAMRHAEAHCKANKLRLTPVREQVLRIVWQTHKPLGAYDILEQLQSKSTRRIAPPTVYRALDFLLEQGLIHRINSLNAFLGCNNPEHGTPHHFLLCEACGVAEEFTLDNVTGALQQYAQEKGFQWLRQMIEVTGLCAQCQAKATT